MNKMNDMQFDLMTALDRHIANKNMMESKDRDIKDIIFNCYSNLKSTIVAAYDWSIADLETLFHCTFKDYIIKLTKNKDYEYSVDVDYLDNIFSKLRLKYIIDPQHVSTKYRRYALRNTIARWEENVTGYEIINDNVYKYLVEEYEKEEAAWAEALAKYKQEQSAVPEEGVKKRGRKKSMAATILEQQSLKDEEREADLFVNEQIILVPEIDRNGKYNIDDINYYGVYNNVDKGIISKNKELGFKTFKDGKVQAAYYGIEQDEMFGYVLYVQWYGFVHNPFHLLTRKKIIDVNPHDLLVFNNVQKRPDWDELIENTWAKAVYMDDNPDDYTIDVGIKSKKQMHLPIERYRALSQERRYKIELNIGLQMFLDKKDSQEEGDTFFIHLDKLEEVILREINGEKKVPDNINPTKGAKRINLSPNLITTIIKKNSDENADTVLFRDNKKEPNPFDIFNIFAYAQITNHTQTRSNTKTPNKAKKTGESTNWIKWKDLPYLGIYFSKNNKPLGKNNILHFNISDDIIVERSRRKEIFRDIYNSTTL